MDWVAEFFKDADRKQLDALTAWFSDDIEVRFGNAPPIRGKRAATESFDGFFSSISGMQHKRETLVSSGDIAAQMSIVTYTRLDGSKASMPVASHLRRVADRKIDRLWIYIDMAPLFAAAG